MRPWAELRRKERSCTEFVSSNPLDTEDYHIMIDIALGVTPKMADVASENTAKSLIGHIGTHFDVMDKEFPLEYTLRKGIVFDVSAVKDRDIEAEDIDLSLVEKDMFVAFYTGFTKDVAYGTPTYFKTHPQLSFQLIEALLEKGISIIGIDCAGIRRTPEHVPADQRCADLSKADADPLHVIAWRNIYRCLEACADVCEHVSECVGSVIMKNT